MATHFYTTSIDDIALNVENIANELVEDGQNFYWLRKNCII